MQWAMKPNKLCKLGCLDVSPKRLDAIAQQGLQVPIAAYISVLKECSGHKALEHGKLLHCHIHICGVAPNLILENTLVDMYGKCGSLRDAHNTFNHMATHNVYSWTAIITAHTKQDEGFEAIKLYFMMRCKGITPDKYVALVVFKACAAMEALQNGRYVHGDIITCTIELDCFLCSTLLDMYAKCKCIPDARKVFDNMKTRDVVSWNSMISGYAQQGPEKEAIVLFKDMQERFVKPNEITYAFVIKACGALTDLEYGQQVHRYVTHSGFSDNIFVANSLLDMYVKCHSLLNAQDVFVKMPDRDVISWTIFMAGHVQKGLGRRALMLYREMLQYGLIPNGATFVTAFNACAREELYNEGRQLHSQIVEMGLPMDTFIGSSIVDMYAKCGSIADASSAFTMMPNQDVISWNTVIGGCSQQGLHEKAFFLFNKMHQAGVEPGGVTFASIIKASAGFAVLELGRKLHAYVVEKALMYDMFVGSALVDMYAKCQNIQDAHHVFLNMGEQDTVVWNTMLMGYAQQGLEEEAVMLFESMTSQEVSPSEITFTIVLKACANLTVLEWAKLLHCQISQTGCEFFPLVGSAFLDVYAKCGSIEDARSMFQKTCPRDVVAWTAMINGHTLQGCGKEAFALYEKMQEEGIQPNEITFIGVLCGCSHAGLLDEAHWLFSSMINYYGIAPVRDHFACMVDLFSRAGLLEGAFIVLKAMPLSANEVLWMSLLGVCKVFGHVELAEKVTEEAMKLNSQNSRVLVQLSNIYAVAETMELG